MNTIWKYEIPLKERFIKAMPMGAEILHVARQGDSQYFWALVDDEVEVADHGFFLIGTGHHVPEYPSKHVGTWQVGPFVWHLFQETA